MIKECGVWSKVIEVWLKESPVNLEDYKKLRQKFERSKAIVNALFSKLNPSQDFKTYCEATRILFEAIQKVTGKSVIVDSSKSPLRIAVLNKIVDLKVIHLCRNTKGILNYAKKSAKKDINAATETVFPVRRTSKTLLQWVFVNGITELFCIDVASKKIKYKEYIANLKTLETLHPKIKIPNEQSFSTPHMIAGNILRLKKNIKVDV